VQDNDPLLAVNQLFDNFEENYQLLISKNEISFATEYKGQFAKILLLACASYFETRIANVVLDTLDTKNCSLTHSFISKKALSRQYHTLFDWKGKNANSFFGLFGEDFREFMKKRVTEDESLKNSIKDFLELGHLRNQLVHDNYATVTLSLTVEDINEKFISAQSFVSKIEPFSHEYRNNLTKKSS
jgi:hypothetical protein